MKWFFLFYKWGRSEAERQPKIIQATSCRAKVQTQVCLIPCDHSSSACCPQTSKVFMYRLWGAVGRGGSKPTQIKWKCIYPCIYLRAGSYVILSDSQKNPWSEKDWELLALWWTPWGQDTSLAHNRPLGNLAKLFHLSHCINKPQGTPVPWRSRHVLRGRPEHWLLDFWFGHREPQIPSQLPSNQLIFPFFPKKCLDAYYIQTQR